MLRRRTVRHRRRNRRTMRKNRKPKFRGGGFNAFSSPLTDTFVKIGSNSVSDLFYSP